MEGKNIMHEFGIVEGIVNNVLPQLDMQGVKHIAQVHFRRGSAFNEDALRW
jgi:Zn finger protein HypA/HybF involved in hydrogenase expression